MKHDPPDIHTKFDNNRSSSFGDYVSNTHAQEVKTIKAIEDLSIFLIILNPVLTLPNLQFRIF